MDVKRTAKLSAVALLIFLLAGFGSCAAYFLPSTVKVRIEGTEIKRKDAKDGTPMHDVRYIQTQQLDGSSLIFRNEDTGWGLPPYFKFRSADLAGEAQAIAKTQPEAVVLVTYYGVRSQILDAYPNIIDFKIVDANHVHVPIFNIVFAIVMLVLAIVAWRSARRLIGKGQAWWARHRSPRQ